MAEATRRGSEEIRIETSRLILRPLGPGDHESLHAMLNDSEVGRYLCDGEPVSDTTTETYLHRSEREFADRCVGLFGISLRGDTELVGFCGFSRDEETREMELMYGLLREWWGRGFATEAARASLRYAFEEAGVERVLASVDEPNAASLRVVGKLGMRAVEESLPAAPEVLYFTLSRQEFEERGEHRVGEREREDV